MSDFSSLCVTVVSWLAYQASCRRDMLFSESYLAHPIGEALRAIHKGEIKTEYSHVELKTAKQGRPRQVDYALFARPRRKKGETSKEASEAKKTVQAVFEVKWVRKHGIPKQALIQDLLRLELLEGSTSYFLIAGTADNLEANIAKVGDADPESFAAYFLSSKTDDFDVSLVEAPAHLRTNLIEFQLGYGQTECPTWIRTRLIGDEESNGFRAMLWKVDSGNGRRTMFSPKAVWPDVLAKIEKRKKKASFDDNG